MSEQAFHRAIIGEDFEDMEATAIADEHYHLRCGTMPCRCTCRACLMRSLRYCEEHHLTTPKNSANTAGERWAEGWRAGLSHGISQMAPYFDKAEAAFKALGWKVDDKLVSVSIRPTDTASSERSGSGQ